MSYQSLVKSYVKGTPFIPSGELIRKWEKLIHEQYRLFLRYEQITPVYLHNDAPYDSIKNIKSDIDLGYILVYDGELNHPYLSTQRLLEYRAVHAWHYTLCNAKSIGLLGEFETYEYLAGFTDDILLKKVLFSEIVLQAAYYDTFSCWPNEYKIVIV